jgi:four helix bundle protein
MWPHFERDTIGKQLVRAADSIGANIAEGFGRGNGPDQKRFVRIARGSVCEVKHWLRLAYGRDLLKKDEIEVLKPILEELPPRLNAYLRAVGRSRASTINNQHSTII